MKLFANIYTDLETDALALGLGLRHWHSKKMAEHHYQFTAKNVCLSLEGSKELLFFGEIDLPLEVVDAWVASLAELSIHFTIDLHGDEARLIRRYCQ